MSARGNEEEEEEVGCGGGGANLSTREIKKGKKEGRKGEETTFCLRRPSQMFCPPSQPWRGKTKKKFAFPFYSTPKGTPLPVGGHATHRLKYSDIGT